MKLVLQDLIDPDQVGFVKGRSSAQNIRKLLDIIEYTWMKRIPGLIVQVDLEKAFDRVSYSALYDILRFFGFGEKFIDWIKLLFADFNLCTSNNGYFSTYFTPTRGLFQGNPVAPFLFLFVAEILAIHLRKNPRIRGIKVGTIEYLLSMFADDLDLLLDHDRDVWGEVMNEFDQFEKITGMKVSYEKTTIYRIGSIRNSNAKFYSVRKVQWTSDPINILGVHIANTDQDLIKLNYDTVLDKIKKVLETWSHRSLSLIGKVQIINSLVASLIVYKGMVLPRITNQLHEAMKKEIGKFLWDGKKAKN